MSAAAVRHRGGHSLRVIGAVILGLGLAGGLVGCSTGASNAGATTPFGSPTGAPEEASASGTPEPPPTPVGEVLSTVPAPLPSLGALASGAATPTPTPSASDPSGPQLHTPLPSTASRQGDLVKGFPTQIIPVPPHADVVSSSVSSQGRRLQVGLQASTPAAPASIRGTYTQQLTGQGFHALPARSSPPVGSPGSAGSPTGPVELRFTRGDDAVTVSVRAHAGGGTELVLIGTLVAAGCDSAGSAGCAGDDG